MASCSYKGCKISVTSQIYSKIQKRSLIKNGSKLQGKTNTSNRTRNNSSYIDYIVNCAKVFYGPSLKHYRQLAFEPAVQNNLAIPESRDIHQLASEAWIKGFHQHFGDLSLRTPEGCSLGHVIGFNQLM